MTIYGKTRYKQKCDTSIFKQQRLDQGYESQEFVNYFGKFSRGN